MCWSFHGGISNARFNLSYFVSKRWDTGICVGKCSCSIATNQRAMPKIGEYACGWPPRWFADIWSAEVRWVTSRSFSRDLPCAVFSFPVHRKQESWNESWCWHSTDRGRQNLSLFVFIQIQKKWTRYIYDDKINQDLQEPRPNELGRQRSIAETLDLLNLLSKKEL